MPRHAGLIRPLQRLMSQLRAGRAPITHENLYAFGKKTRTVNVPSTSAVC